jgi:4-amino-4-deoxy-L-arabinose transferase-like glycosyltransferase
VSSGSYRWFVAALALYFLIFFGLSGMGVVGPDEPRYASIGREMARSGDWVTPRLWGSPWFEKPPLIYWMTALATRAGLDQDTAPRLPVALASLAFLLFYFRVLRREFGPAPALYATVMLGTCAGWVGYSRIGATDLPMTAAFAAAMLLSLGWVGREERKGLAAAGAWLGVAVLAKGLVPLALAIPLWWMGRKRWRDWVVPGVILLLVAGPWYAAVTLRNGWAFIDEFFVRQHFARLASNSLMHGQPVWFYLPVLFGGLFPWTPMLLLAGRKGLYVDRRLRFLLGWVLFGLVFFSVSTNKLPGYLLPLLPAVAALAGVALAGIKQAKWWLTSVAALLLLVPAGAQVLPHALAAGLSRAPRGRLDWYWIPAAMLVAGACWWLEKKGRRQSAVRLLGGVIVAGVVVLECTTLAGIDRMVSARPLWRSIRDHSDQVCVERMHRSWRYGLNYYSGVPLPECSVAPRPLRIEQMPGRPPYVSAGEPNLSPSSRPPESSR